MFKAIHGLAPKYLCDLLTFQSSLHNLRSSGSILLSMPAVRLKTTLGDRAFMVAAPTLWNSLPKELRAITNVNWTLGTYSIKIMLHIKYKGTTLNSLKIAEMSLMMACSL